MHIIMKLFLVYAGVKLSTLAQIRVFETQKRACDLFLSYASVHALVFSITNFSFHRMNVF